MFKKDTIGAHVNAILVKHGEDMYCDYSFEEQVKKSSKLFRNIFTLNAYNPDKMGMIFNPYSKKTQMVEDWIAFVHYELIMAQMSGFNFTEFDCMVIDSFKTALMLEYNEIYYDFFD